MHGRCRCGRGCRRLTASSGVSSPSARCSAPSSPPPSAPLVGLFRWSARASLEVLCISLRTCAGCQLPVTWRHREKGEASRRDSSGFVPCSVPDRPYPDWTPTDATGGPWFPRFNGAMIWARAALFKIDVSWLMTLTSTGPIVSLPLSYLIKGQPLNFGSLKPPVCALFTWVCATQPLRASASHARELLGVVLSSFSLLLLPTRRTPPHRPLILRHTSF